MLEDPPLGRGAARHRPGQLVNHLAPWGGLPDRRRGHGKSSALTRLREPAGEIAATLGGNSASVGCPRPDSAAIQGLCKQPARGSFADSTESVCEFQAKKEPPRNRGFFRAQLSFEPVSASFSVSGCGGVTISGRPVSAFEPSRFVAVDGRHRCQARQLDRRRQSRRLRSEWERMRPPLSPSPRYCQAAPRPEGTSHARVGGTRCPAWSTDRSRASRART